MHKKLILAALALTLMSPALAMEGKPDSQKNPLMQAMIPEDQIPAGRAGEFVRKMQTQNAHFRQALQNPKAAQNLIALISHPAFSEALNRQPTGDTIANNLDRMFNHSDFPKFVTNTTWVDKMIGGLQVSLITDPRSIAFIKKQ